jgi:hypothetical protein
MLAGFCYGGLSIDSDKPSWIIQFGYLAFTTLGMGFGLLVIVIASLCSMLGPGLALRGPDGPNSVHLAVDTMKEESVMCFYFFILQLLFFHLSSFMLIWYLYPPTVAIVVNIVLLIFLMVFVANGAEIFSKLYIKDIDAVSGKFGDFAKTY